MVLKLRNFAWKITILTMILLFLQGVGIMTAAAASEPTLSKTSISMLKNETVQLKLKHASGKITWKTTNSRVARVDSRGKVRAVSIGKCFVYAKYDGTTYRCKVQVFKTKGQKRKNEIKTSYSTAKDQGKIVLAGSSSIEFWTSAKTAFAPLEVVNTGIAGTTAASWLKRYQSLIVKYKPRAVILYMGGNDVWQGKSANATAKVLCTIMKKLKKELPGTPVYFISLSPNAARWKTWNQLSLINRKVQQFCAETEDLNYIDCTSYLLKNGKPRRELYRADKLHFNSRGYAVWNKVVVKQVKADLKKYENMKTTTVTAEIQETTIEQVD